MFDRLLNTPLLIKQEEVTTCKDLSYWQKVFLKILQFSQENVCVGVSFFNNVGSLKACNFNKMKLKNKCFPVKFVKLLRKPFFTKHLRWLY